MIFGARDLLGSELGEVLGHELGVEQPVSPGDQPRHQVHQRHLRGVAPSREHALAEEGPAQRDTVETSHELFIEPALEAVGVAQLVKAHVEPFDRAVDPGLGAARPGGGAGQDDLMEGRIRADLERIASHRARQPAGDVEAVQRNHAPPLRIDQEHAGVLACIRHREDAAGVAVE